MNSTGRQLGPISSGPVCERKRSQVECQLDEIREVIVAVRDQVDRLEGKLIPVTRDEEPKDCTNGCVDTYLVPVADQIRAGRYQLQVIADRLDSLFNRIEL